MRTIQLALVALLVLMNPPWVYGGECVFDPKGLPQIKIGDPEQKIREAFTADYSVAERSTQGAQRRIEVLQLPSRERLYSFSLSNDGRVVFIDIYAACRNRDGIGLGSRLGDAKKRYGNAKLEPTDTGYFVVFNRMPTVGFMLNNDDLPKKLRGLLDDSIDTKAERAILAASRARFSQVRIYPE